MLARKFACLVLIVSSVPLYGKSSYIKPEGCGLMSAEHLHIQKINDHKLVNQIVLYLPGEGAWEDMENSWFDVQGTQCLKSGHCENAAHAKIQILHVPRKFSSRWGARVIQGLAGNFSIEFKNGRKLRGSFDANERTAAKTLICE